MQLSIAGSVSCSIFLLAERLLFRNMTARFTVKLYFWILLSFVLPFFYILEVYDGSNILFVQGNGMIDIERNSMADTFFTIMKHTLVIDMLQGLWLIGMFLYLYCIFKRFMKLKSVLKRNRFSIENTIWQETLCRICQKENRKTIVLFAATKLPQPCIMGIRKHTIYIPAILLNQCTEKEIELILYHEVTHSKRKDMLLKIVIHTLNCINWFNPLFYYIKNSLYEWTELACDEEMTTAFSTEQKREYVNTILHLFAEDMIQNSQWNVSSFGESEADKLNRRVKAVMEKKSNYKWGYKLLAIGCLAVAFGTGTKVEKAADTTVNDLFSKQTEIAYIGEYTFYKEGELDLLDSYNDYMEFDDIQLQNDIENGTANQFLFTTEENVTYRLITPEEVIDITKNDTNVSPKHVHTYKDGNVSKHTKYSDGSCKTTIYAAKYCTGCDYVIKGDVLNEQTNKPCPH